MSEMMKTTVQNDKLTDDYKAPCGALMAPWGDDWLCPVAIHVHERWLCVHTDCPDHPLGTHKQTSIESIQDQVGEVEALVARYCALRYRQLTKSATSDVAA